MGIKDFTKVFPPQGEYKKISAIVKPGCGMAKDASNEIHRALKGISNVHQLTDADGNPTIHIKVILANELECRKMGIQTFWVFDNPEPHPYKTEEIERRRSIKRANEEKLEQATDASEIARLKKATTGLDAARVQEVKHLLTLLGVPWTQVPQDLEAEQVCAMLTRQREDIQYVLSTDADVLAFGARHLVKRTTKEHKTVYQHFDLERILEDNDLTVADLAKIALMLGADFGGPKVPRVGPKTVLTKFRDHELNAVKQEVLEKVFLQEFDVDQLEWTTGEMNKAELTSWLTSKGFSAFKVHEQLSKV